jgi:hypothetical protein
MVLVQQWHDLGRDVCSLADHLGGLQRPRVRAGKDQVDSRIDELPSGRRGLPAAEVRERAVNGRAVDAGVGLRLGVADEEEQHQARNATGWSGRHAAG